MTLSPASFSSQEHAFMNRALHLAERGLYTTSPNPRVGCVLVKHNQVIGEGWHFRAGQRHAEIVALDDCQEDPRGATAFVTLEPCSFTGRTGPCADALIQAGIAEVVFAHQDPHPRVSGAGQELLEQAGVEVRVGLMEQEARELNRGFIHRITNNRPFVQLKIAASLDGATALANGQSQWITGPEARQDVHVLRAQSCAILTGVGTVIADDPQMTARLGQDIEINQPMPVILDSSAQCSSQAKIFSQKSCVFIAKGATTKNIPTVEYIEIDHQLPCEEYSFYRLDLAQVLRHLAQREINQVLIEAGPKVSGSFLRAGLVDQMIVYQAPVLLGSGSRRMLDVGPFESMDDVMRYKVNERTTLGDCSKLVIEVRQ